MNEKDFKDKPICELENEIEAQILAQVLDEMGVNYRLESAEDGYFGILMGRGVQMMSGWGRIWGYAGDEGIIKATLEEVRHAALIDHDADDYEPLSDDDEDWQASNAGGGDSADKDEA
ncbi:MAG: hypothetical protein Q4B96_03305 [Bacillota bacterium]|nr:hypothetical protein [Bacillota bacterium]